MHKSPYTSWSQWWVSAAGIPSLTRNSMTTRWRNETLLSAIMYHVFMVTWCKLLKPYRIQRYDNIWLHIPNDTQTFDVAELPAMRRCSWLSAWPSYIVARLAGHSKLWRHVNWRQLYSLPWCQNTPCPAPTGPSQNINDVCRTQVMLTCCNQMASQSHRLR